MAGVQGRVALVTGAGSHEGIGFACARLLLAAGAKVAITSTTARIFERLEELDAVEPPGAAQTFAQPADLTRPDEVSALVEAVGRSLGPVEILVNNAGMTQIGGDEPTGPLAETTERSWDYGIDINLKTAFLVTRAVLPTMLQRCYGRIVQISSITGPLVGIPGSSVYATAKAGMLGMTRALALEVSGQNVTVNAIGPGWIATASSSDEERTAGRYTPVGRPGTPEEVGHVAVFLAGEEASYVTGQLIVVDGGNSIQEYKVALA